MIPLIISIKQAVAGPDHLAAGINHHNTKPFP
jgi:hypothetical protein